MSKQYFVMKKVMQLVLIIWIITKNWRRRYVDAQTTPPWQCRQAAVS